MTAPGPKVLLLLASSDERSRCYQLLAEHPTWQGHILSPSDLKAAAVSPAAPSPPDVILTDCRGFATQWPALPMSWRAALPAVLWLLTDGETVPPPAVAPETPYDYLLASQLDSTRLHLTLQNLSRQRRLQQHLDECHQLGDLFRQARIGINQTDATGHYVRVNQRFCDLLGYTEAELLQLPYPAVTHPEDLEKQGTLEQQLWNCETSGITLEKRYIAKDGHTVWARVTLSAIANPQQQPVSILAVVEDITDRVRLERDRQVTEAHLAQSEARLNEAQRLAHLGHWEYDLVTGHLAWSQELLRQYGFAESLAGPSFEDFIDRIHPSDWPTLEHAIHTLTTTGTPYELHHRIVRPDGMVRHTVCKGRAIFNDQGQVIKTFGVSQDVTATWEAEQALQASEWRYRQLIEHMPNGAVQILDRDLRITYVGGQVLTQLGLTPRDLLGMHPSELLAAEDWATLAPLMQQALQGAATQGEARHGNYAFLMSFAPLYDARGQIEGLISVTQDITSLKQAQIALRASEQRYATLAESAPVGIFQLDPAGHLLYVNSYWCEMTGHTLATLTDSWQEWIHPDDRERVQQELGAVLAQGSTFQSEARQIRRDGSVGWFSAHIVPEFDAQGDIIGYLGTVTDITDRKQAEAALQAANQNMEAIFEAFPDLLFQLRADGTIQNYKARNNNYFYASPNVFVGQKVQDLLPPATGQQVYKALQQALATDAVVSVEYPLLMAGQERFFDARIVALNAFDARIVALNATDLIAVVRDISDRKQAELDRQRATEELDRFFSASLDLLCIANTDGYFLRLNPAWESTLGYSLADLQARPFLDFVHEDDIASTLTAIAQLIEQQEVLNFVNRYRHRDGSYRWIEWRSIPLGSLIYAAARDITDRRVAELQLARQNVLLAQIARGAPLPVVLQALVAEIETQLPDALCSILLLDQDNRLRHGATQRLPEAYVELVEGVEIGEGVGSCGTAAWRNAVIVVEDIAQDPLWQDYQAVALRFNLRACWSFPIVSSGGQVLGVFGTYYPTARSPQSYELQVIEQIAYLAGIALERQQSEATIIASEARFRQIAETVQEGFFVINLPDPSTPLEQQSYAYINPAYAAITGFPPDTITAARQLWFNNIHPDDQPRMAAVIEHQTQGVNYNEEYRYCRPDGEVRWLRSQAFPITDDTGTVVRILGTVKDITDRKQAELALQELNEELEARVQERTQELTRSERDLRTIFNNVYDALFIHDLDDGTILDVNDRALAMSGATRGQLVGARLTELSGPDAPLDQAPEYLRRVRAGEILCFEWQNRRFDDNTPFDTEVTLRRVSLWNRTVILAGVRDISDRKRLQQEQQRLLNLLEASPDHIGIALPDGTLIWNNHQAKHLRGLPPDIDLPQLSLNIYHPQWAQDLLWQEAIPTALRGDIWRGETALLTADGGEMPVSQLVWAHYAETGEVEYMATIIRDISDRKQAEQALREANADLENRVAERTAELVEARDAAENANQAKSIFLANMSHELRTPLNAILGFSQLLGRDTTLSPQHLEHLKIINRSGEHLLTLINDILEMSKIEAGQATLNQEICNLPQLLDGLVDMLRLKAESKGLRLTLSSHPTVPTYISTDSHKLRQVLLNLLSNAIKFTQVGYVVLQVTPVASWLDDPEPTSARQEDDPSTLALHFAVADSGVGIAPEEMDLLFKPFVQTTSGRLSQEGTGLGLPITHQFVQLMGGELTVTSQPGVGSTFAFTIPVQVEPATVEPPLPLQRVVAIAPGQPEYRILVVEDNWANCALLQNLLADLGFLVQTAANGQEAIDLWQHWQPHLILMDIQMPVMDGCEATRVIRQREQLAATSAPAPRTIIISLTAGALQSDDRDWSALGFDDLIHKPIQATAITQALAQHLGITYQYEPVPTGEKIPAAASITHLTIEQLRPLPQDWLMQFYQALMELHQEKLLALLATLPPEQTAIAQALHHKVNDFDYEPLLDLIQTILAI